MSRVNDGMYSSNNQKWMTEGGFLAKLLAFEGRTHFDLDPACSIRNVPAYAHFLFPEFDALARDWAVGLCETLCFLNPPYGSHLALFLKKCNEQSQKGVRIWALVPARTCTKYQHKYGLAAAGFTVFLSGRLKFIPEPDYRPTLIRERFEKAVGKKEHKGWSPIRLTKKIIREINDGTAPFPTMLLYYGDDWREKAKRWQDDPPFEGTLMTRLTF